MNIVSPLNSLHRIYVIPRFYTDDIFNFKLYNKSSKTTSEDLYTSHEDLDGVFVVDFNFTFSEGDKYTAILEQQMGSEKKTIYIGEVFATNQNYPEYKQSNDLYYYE